MVPHLVFYLSSGGLNFTLEYKKYFMTNRLFISERLTLRGLVTVVGDTLNLFLKKKKWVYFY